MILIGEMRDLETMETALTIAETGHLVLRHAAHELDLRVDQPHRGLVPARPARARSYSQLAFVLKGVVTQQLLPAASGGRAASMAAEVLVCTPAIAAVIREGKIHQIYSLMQAGQKFGMQTMNQSLAALYNRREISYEDAIGRSPDPKEFEGMVGRAMAVA